MNFSPVWSSLSHHIKKNTAQLKMVCFCWDKLFCVLRYGTVSIEPWLCSAGLHYIAKLFWRTYNNNEQQHPTGGQNATREWCFNYKTLCYFLNSDPSSHICRKEHTWTWKHMKMIARVGDVEMALSKCVIPYPFEAWGSCQLFRRLKEMSTSPLCLILLHSTAPCLGAVGSGGPALDLVMLQDKRHSNHLQQPGEGLPTLLGS